MTPKLYADLLNQCEAPRRIMLFTLPLRTIRIVTMDESFKTFRVEQLVMHNNDRHNPKGAWQTLSTHGGAVQGGAYMLAIEAALAAQHELHNKLVKRAQRKQLVHA